MKRISALLGYVLMLSALITACGSPGLGNMAISDKNREENPLRLEGDVQSLVNGNNAFALDIYHSLRSGGGNLILSPYSISLALAMTYAGARGETEAQMADVLHFAQGQTPTHNSFNALDLGLAQRGEGKDKDQEPMKLNIANAVWAEQTLPFQQEFLDTVAVNYGAGVHLADFVNEFEPARREINSWVSDRTEDRINDLLPEGILNAYTRMVLVNAIYFKADWLSPFDADSTDDEPFHLLDGSTVETPFMNDDLFIPHAQGDGYQAVELAYAGQTAAMDIIVPDEGRFDEIESALDHEMLNTILNGMQEKSVSLSLPKFEYDASFNLSDTLKGMGMTDAFDNDLADFSGMTGQKDLYISDVVHKAFVAVDEEGTEAAAATAVIMELTSAMLPENVLTIDRPFIFVIRDTVSGQILFVGRVLNPAD
jgi:serpin B